MQEAQLTNCMLTLAKDGSLHDKYTNSTLCERETMLKSWGLTEKQQAAVLSGQSRAVSDEIDAEALTSEILKARMVPFRHHIQLVIDSDL
jgi:hypothetical protein